MPELPEVETVRRGLAEQAVGRTVAKVEVFHPRAVRRHLAGPDDFAGSLTGRTVVAAHRRGKFLWLPLGQSGGGWRAPGSGAAEVSAGSHAGWHRAALPPHGEGKGPAAWEASPLVPGQAAPDLALGKALDEPDALIGHLGMSGQLLLQPTGAPDNPHLRVRFTFTDSGPQLCFVDQRTFGGLSVSPYAGTGVPDQIAHIAPDPLDEAFDADGFVTALRKRRVAVKVALLDQNLISGVGNIYADEALWRAKLHGQRRCDTLTRPTIHRVLGHVREVLAEAIDAGGTSFDALYVDVNGDSGWFERALHVYGREGEPCVRCGTRIRREPFTNRSSYACPRCQRRSP